MNQSTLLKEQAYDYMKKMIQEGKYDQDTVLSLAVIAKKLNMSKTPVRDAVQRLSKERFLEILPSRGIRIVQYSPKEIVELFQTRYAISDFCCTMLSLKHIEEPEHPIFKKMEDTIAEQENLKNADFDTYYNSDWKFHMLMIEGLSNKYFQEIMDNRKDVYMSFARNCRPHSLTVSESIAEHRRIYEGICEGNVMKSRLASHKHIVRTLRANLKGEDGIDEFIRKMIPIELIKAEN